MSGVHKHPTISFRVSDREWEMIEAKILASGMQKKDYFVRSCIYNRSYWQIERRLLMSASKDKDRETWIAYIRYKDWKGENQVHKKRGFATKREALEYEKDGSGKCTDNATKQWKKMERAHFRKICIKHGLTVDEEIKTTERDSLSVFEYKAEMRKWEIQKLETQEKELRGTLRNLQSLIKQAEGKLEEAKKEAVNIIESAQVKANEWLEKINIRLGLIPKKDIEDKRLELVSYYRACEPYLTNDMRIAIKNEDVNGFGALVNRLTASNPDGTVARRDPGREELFDFEIKFWEYLDMKNKNVKTEDIIKELEHSKPERRKNR